jgi:hypothetical protein
MSALWKKPERNVTKILNLLTENIEISYASPEDKIVEQNDEFNGLIYFVYKGRFIVQSTEFGAGPGEVESLR